MIWLVLDEAREPEQGQDAAEQQQDQSSAREARGHLAFYVLVAQLGGQVGIDGAGFGAVGGGGGTTTGLGGDLPQLLRADRHRHVDGLTVALDRYLPTRAPVGRGVDGG